MNNETNAETGIALIRISLGLMWLSHAMLKWQVFTIAGFAGWLESQGLPGFMAWPVFLLEMIGGIAIVMGYYGRYFSAILIPVMMVATWTHLPNGWVHTSAGGGWEYPVFLIAMSMAHFLLGDGKFTIQAFRNNNAMA